MTSSRARGGLTISTRANNPQDTPKSAPAPRATTSGKGAPAVVAVLVTHDPDEHFETTLASLDQQDYTNLSVLVLDNQSESPVEDRVKAVLPDAHVVRLAANRGYGAAANRAPAVVNGASFYVFCHDDVYLEPDAVSALVTEAFRSNAGIVGPKFVDWDEPEMLLDVGKAVDKFGFPAPVAEPGELDQAQHDAVRDTFAVNGATMLVRADLFEAIDGFPSDFSAYDEDTDLCWRAHLAGARVVVTPTAVVRHREATLRTVPPEERMRKEYAHRARMVLTNYSGAHLVRVLPQAVLFSFGDLILNLLAFRLAKAADVALAWTWNVAHLKRSLAIRRQVKAFRRAPDSEIRNYQVGGSARVTAFVRGTVGEGAARINSGARQSRTVVQRLREGPSQIAALSALLVGMVLIIGSRGIILGDIPVVREFSDTTAPWSSMLREYWDGWRTTGLGAGAATPTLVGAMGALSTALFGGEGLVRNLLIVGCLPAGVIGAWWMARGGSSSKTRALMMVAYAITPVPYNAIAEGRWGALGLWAGLPWMLGLLGRSAGAMPFAGSEFRTLSGLRATVALGMVTAAVTAVLPVAPIIMIILALVVAGVGLVDRSDLARWERALPTALGASVVTFALHLPWAMDLLVPWPHWDQMVGPPSTAGGPVVLRDLVWLDTGVNSFGVVLVGLHLAGAFAVLVGREWRFRLAVQGWSVALVGWVLAWLGEARIGPTLPPPEVLLMLPVLGLAVAIGAGLAAFERDVAGSDFGFRQVFSMMAATLMVVASVAWVARSANGQWGLPDEDNLAVVGTLESQAPDGQYRTLWLGDPDVLPMGSWPLPNGSSYATTAGLFPRIGDWFEGPESQGTAALEEALEDAVAGKTTRLGRLLGPMGIKFVVVARSGAPLAYDKGNAVVEPPASTVNALDEQLDLARLSVSESLYIYDNAAFSPEVAELPAGTLDDSGDDLAAMLSADLSDGQAVLPDGRRFAEGIGELDAESQLYVARTRDANWTLTVAGQEVVQEATFGWATRADTGEGGAATLAYSPPLTRSLAVILQILALLAAINVVRRRRGGAELGGSGGVLRALADRRARVAERRERREHSPELDGPLLPTSELPNFTVEGDDSDYQTSFQASEPGQEDAAGAADAPNFVEGDPAEDDSPDDVGEAGVVEDEAKPRRSRSRRRPKSAVPAEPASTPTSDSDEKVGDERLISDSTDWDPGELEPDWLAEPPATKRRRRRNVVLPDELEAADAALETSSDAEPTGPDSSGSRSDADELIAASPSADAEQVDESEVHDVQLHEAPGLEPDDAPSGAAGSPDHPAGSGSRRRSRPRLRLVRGKGEAEGVDQRTTAEAEVSADPSAPEASESSSSAELAPVEDTTSTPTEADSTPVRRVVRRKTRRQSSLVEDKAGAEAEAGTEADAEAEAETDGEGDQP